MADLVPWSIFFPPPMANSSSSFAACSIAVMSMAKVGIVGQRKETRLEEDAVELGER